jgi:hypothetical protein
MLGSEDAANNPFTTANLIGADDCPVVDFVAAFLNRV